MGGHMAGELDEPRGSGVIKKRQNSNVARREFQREAKRILDGWVYRRRLQRQGLAEFASMGENENPIDWMIPHTYRLVRSLIRAGHVGILHDLLNEVGQRHRGKTDISDKPFKQALLVMFWWNPEHTQEPLLDRRRRSELSDAMEYAYLQGVQAKYLNVFIKSAGKKKIPAKLRGGKCEPGFSP